MRILDRILGKMEEGAYIYVLRQVANPLIKKINTIKEKEVRGFFKVVLDAAERSLWGVLFMAPGELEFKTPLIEQDKTFWEKGMKGKSVFYKQLTKEDIDFWLRKVSLALISYSYYFYDNAPEAESNQDLGNLINKSYKLYWQRMFNYYNQIFNENINQKEIDYYASGLKEDIEKGYTKSGNMEKVFKLTVRDYKIIASELLQNIWREDFYLNEKKELFLGTRIWQAYQQIVQPFLVKLLKM